MNRADLEEKAEEALLFLHQKAHDHAAARAKHDYLSAWVKSVKARVKGEQAGKMSVAAAEDYALNHPDYHEALTELRQASEDWYAIAFLREAARAHIDAFQTVSANERMSA